MSSRVVTCADCHRDRPHHAHGKCYLCYQRPNRPVTGVGSGGPGVTKSRDVIAAHLEDLAELMTHETDQLVIAARLGVSWRTIYRYRARLRERAA
ncbi:hypothetical protein [Microtetraspora malaysiensis]|uniref:DNA binding HTH domain-containing protein n=1 Tax=Microtetraspora malaysiensis TaxID=161358 RepID=A0ABW6SKA2_9ACTN